MKKQSGISLVALIITIIVMVILAGIIIVSAVADGGIIDRVQGAAKEHERAEIEDLVIASYVYKETASQGNNYAVLDLDQTAEAIYKNLTDNGFTIKGKDGEASEKVEDFYDKGSGNNIQIEVEGKYDEYTGEVDKDGLISGINPKDEDDDEDDNIDPELKGDLEKLRTYFVKSGKYIIDTENGQKTSLIDLTKIEDGIFQFAESEGLTQAEANSIIILDELFGSIATMPKTIYIQFNKGIYEIDCIYEGDGSGMSIKATDVNVYQKISDDLPDLEKLKRYFVGNYIINTAETEETVEAEKSLVNLASIAGGGFQTAEFIGNEIIEDAKTELKIRFDMFSTEGPPTKINIQYNGCVYRVECEYTELEPDGMQLKATNVVFCYKIEDPDLEFLRANIMVLQSEEPEFGKEITLKTLDGKEEFKITINKDIYYKEIDDINCYMYRIIYKNQNFIYKQEVEDGSVGDSNEPVMSVEREVKTNFYYGEEYICNAINQVVVIQENGDITVTMNGTVQDVPSDSIKIFNNGVYMQTDEDSDTGAKIYMYNGRIEDNGKVFVMIIESEEYAFVYGDGDYGVPKIDDYLYYRLPTENDEENDEENDKGSGALGLLTNPKPAILIDKNRTGIMLMEYSEGIAIVYPFPLLLFNVDYSGVLKMRALFIELSDPQIFGTISENKKLALDEESLSQNNDLGIKPGYTLDNITVPQYDPKVGLEIYNTTEKVALKLENIINIEGNLAYLINEEENRCCAMINYNGMYILVDSDGANYKKENGKLTLAEYDFEQGKETGNTIEYTINGTNLTDKKVITAE